MDHAETDNSFDEEVIFKEQEQADQTVNVFSSALDEIIDTGDELIDVDINNRFVTDRDHEHYGQTPQREGLGTLDRECKGGEVDQAADMVKDAEATKIRMIRTPGKSPTNRLDISAVHHSMVVDENYQLIGGHIDLQLQEKIRQGDYVDFARLLPRE